MSRYTGPKCRLCRRAGMKLCNKKHCATERRKNPPGVHGATAGRRPSEYGLRLREKQKVRIMYGVNERQFRRYYDFAAKQKGETGEVLFQNLELRLDNAVFRAGFATTRSASRQLVSHCHITVNGLPVNIPSYPLKAGDVIAVTGKSKNNTYFKNLQSTAEKEKQPVAPWIHVDPVALEGKVLYKPTREELGLGAFNTQYIIEFYSR
ncbi:MAG: 30S ribosomal protein S4 [bacterium]